ncbi:MAG: hypothetical protein ACREE7_18525 [Dongiaceae bacterium]
MTVALVGSGGFVGSHLARQHRFDHQFGAADLRQLAGRRFDLLVCAGPGGIDGDGDWARIATLTEVLRTVEAGRVVLISTTEVYPAPRGVDETSPIGEEDGAADGRNRLRFERFVRSRFLDTFVFRLPGLFGPGAPKTVLSDLTENNAACNPASRLQWYDVNDLWRDVERCTARGARLVNLAPEPVAMRDILERWFPRRHTDAKIEPVVQDVRTRHAALFGRGDGYILDAAQVLDRIGGYVAAATRRGAA